MKKGTYRITVRLWIYPGESSNWHFVTVPKRESGEITEKFSAKKRGWGSLPVEVKIGKTLWKTSIFPDSKAGTYLLPVKALVRRAEGLEAGDSVTVQFTVKP
jgi:hypothetical protein